MRNDRMTGPARRLGRRLGGAVVLSGASLLLGAGLAGANDTAETAAIVNGPGAIVERIGSEHDLAWFRFALAESGSGGASGSIRVSVAQAGCELDVRVISPYGFADRGSVIARPGAPADTGVVVDHQSEWLLRIVPTAASAHACAGADAEVIFGTASAEAFVPVGSLTSREPYVPPRIPASAPMPPAEPKPAAPRPAPAPAVSARVARAGGDGRLVVVRLDATVGALGSRAYAVQLRRDGRVVAHGTVRGTTLRLHATRPLRLSGSYRLAPKPSARGAWRVAARSLRFG